MDNLTPEIWNSPFGYILCLGCLTEWPCHYAAWVGYSQTCNICGGDLEWSPRDNFSAH